MEFRFRLRDTGILVATAVMVLLLSGASYLLIMSSVDSLVRKDAEQTAYDWLHFLVKSIPDLEDITRGEMPSEDSLRFIKVARTAGRVFRFKIFDRNGRVQLISSKLNNISISNEIIQTYHPSAYSAVLRGDLFTVLKKGTPPRRPTLYTETYLPIMENGELKAIVEVYVDQSGKRFLFQAHFLFASLIIAGLMGLSLAIPAILFYWRTRQKRKADEKIAYLARHDAMTGLANRGFFLKQLTGKVKSAIKDSKMIAIHYLDLDRFKEINDTLGHDAGDQVIIEVADRLKALASEDDVVSRFGGDEFLVAQSDVATPEDAEAFARSIVRSMEAPFNLGGHAYASSCSVGYAIAPYDGHEVAKLIKRADLALYRIKSADRNDCLRFEPAMDVELETRRKLESLIRDAAFEETFTLKFQPVYDAVEDKLVSFEALLRLPLNNNEEVSPSVFVPVAEDMGLINKIGSWVLGAACRSAANWSEDYRIAINLSPLQFKKDDIVSVVSAALKDSGLPSHRLELEITESLLLNDTEVVLKQLCELKSLGVSIVMDDFGTGYSSLSYLWRFPFDKIKIDQSFIRPLTKRDQDIITIVSTIISLGHSLGMKVTAEGIETTEQLEVLHKLGCDQLQGYLFGRPAVEADVATMMLSNFIQNNSDAAGLGENDQEENAEEKINKAASSD